jgi:hypothetical protein
MSWMQQQPSMVDGLPPKPRKWPAILGVTLATWVILSGVVLLILRVQSGN